MTVNCILSRLPPPSTLEVIIPAHAVGKVLGKRGTNIENIRKVHILLYLVSPFQCCNYFTNERIIISYKGQIFFAQSSTANELVLIFELWITSPNHSSVT